MLTTDLARGPLNEAVRDEVIRFAMKFQQYTGPVMAKGLAISSNAMAAISIVLEMEMTPIFETSKVAVSFDPLGTVAGVQLAAVFQSPLAGLRFQVALPA